MPEHGQDTLPRQALPEQNSQLQEFDEFWNAFGFDDNAPLTPNGALKIMQLWEKDQKVRRDARSDAEASRKLKKKDREELERSAKAKRGKPYEIKKDMEKVQEMMDHEFYIEQPNLMLMLRRKFNNLNKEYGKALAANDPKIARLMAGMGEAGTFPVGPGQGVDETPQPPQRIGPQQGSSASRALPPPSRPSLTNLQAGDPSLRGSRALPPRNGTAAPSIGKQNALPTPALQGNVIRIRNPQTGEEFDFDRTTGKKTPVRQ